IRMVWVGYDCMDAGGRQKTAPAFSAFTTSMWLSNAGAVAERQRNPTYIAPMLSGYAIANPTYDCYVLQKHNRNLMNINIYSLT
ncbi:hypothetical protein, partial [Methylocucumis oryzae]